MGRKIARMRLAASSAPAMARLWPSYDATARSSRP